MKCGKYTRIMIFLFLFCKGEKLRGNQRLKKRDTPLALKYSYSYRIERDQELVNKDMAGKIKERNLTQD